MAVSASRRRPDRPRSQASAGSGRRVAPAALLPGLIALLVMAILFGVGIGAVPIGPGQSVAILLDRAGLLALIQSVLSAVGIEWGAQFSAQQSAVLWGIRLPRVLLAGLVGGGLSIAGASLQGVFRNPLADPGIIGVSGGAAFGAVIAIVLGIEWFGLLTTPIFAFAAGMLTALLVYRMARFQGRTEIVTLILTGVALNAIAGAITGFMITIANSEEMRTVTFWSLGSVSGATWRTVGIVAAFSAAGLLLLPRWGQTLNLFVLGEREARHLGVDTERMRIVVIMLAALTTGASVAFTGTIGFVGLVVPHLIRLAAGPDHRLLLPASAIGGAALLIAADLVARTVAAPVELPLGVITALAGGPFFLWLLQRTRRQHGGWG